MSEPRRDFTLPEADVEYLESLGLPWETVIEVTTRMLLIIDGWQVPEGYNVSTAKVAVAIPQGYPDTEIDMAYFSPPLRRSDGQPIRNLSDAAFPSGGTWQQWSRHRTSANRWRPGIDDVSTHLSLVDAWLRREFDQR